MGFNSTQSNYFMLKYSTDVYLISITSNINSIDGSDEQSGEAEPHLSYSNVTEKQLKKN